MSTQPQPKRALCMCHPSCWCLLTTVCVTTLATGLLAACVFTDFWETVSYNTTRVEELARNRNVTHRLTWLFNGTVARISLYPRAASSHRNRTPLLHSNRRIREIVGRFDHEQHPPLSSNTPNAKWILVHDKAPATHTKVHRPPVEETLIFLVPLHGGIWNLCFTLKDNELQILRDMGMNRSLCAEYLTHETNEDVVPRTIHQVQSKMHNLSISCAMVCLILLAAAALLGTFGILKRQISAVLITGVCYILAALFAVFSLSIMHLKRASKRDSILFDDHVSIEFHQTRIFTHDWSMHLGWAGSSLMFVASLQWLFLSRVMRYNRMSFF